MQWQFMQFEAYLEINGYRFAQIIVHSDTACYSILGGIWVEIPEERKVSQNLDERWLYYTSWVEATLKDLVKWAMFGYSVKAEITLKEGVGLKPSEGIKT